MRLHLLEECQVPTRNTSRTHIQQKLSVKEIYAAQWSNHDEYNPSDLIH